MDGTLGNCSTATACYTYDAEGRRVAKTTAGGTVSYVYDLAEGQAAEMNSSGGWNRGEVYVGAMHLATYANGTTYFDHADWLGTEQVRTNVSAAACETITSLPFGEGLTTSGACNDASPMHFTGYQRDGESGLDDANARYYGSALGRFTGPDPLGIASADFTNPQSLNEYAYVMNNPLNMIDPTGLDFEGDGGDGGDPGIGDGCDFCEAPPVGGPAQPGYHSSHTPFPVPGQGIDWLNWLFGPACTGGPIGNPCVITNITSTACDPSATDCGVTKNCNDDGSGCVLQITVSAPLPSGGKPPDTRHERAAKDAFTGFVISEGVNASFGCIAGGLVGAGAIVATDTYPFAGQGVSSGCAAGALVGVFEGLPSAFTAAFIGYLWGLR